MERYSIYRSEVGSVPCRQRLVDLELDTQRHQKQVLLMSDNWRDAVA